MIARIWKGAVRKQDGDAYADYMQKTGIAGYASTSGSRGVWMLRRDIDEHTEFLMFTLWDSLDSVKAFAAGLRGRRLLPRRRPLPRRARPVLNALLRPYAHRTARQRRGRRPRPRVRDHVAAFNTHDLDHLLACLSTDTPWVTGTAIAPAAPPNSRSCSKAHSRT